MKALIESKDGRWVYGRDDLDEGVIPILFNSRDVGIFDLDDCDAVSPAKRIVYEHARSGGIFNPKFIYWASFYGLGAKSDKRKEGEAFRKYVQLFLDGKNGGRRLRRIYNRFKEKDAVGKMVFPGVQEFYDSLPVDMTKFYLTRSVGVIGELFAEHLGVNYAYSNIVDKAEALKKYVENDAIFGRHFLFKEDFENDALQMIDVLNSFCDKKSSRVESCLSVLVSDKPDKCPEGFDFVISKDHNGLVGLMKGALSG